MRKTLFLIILNFIYFSSCAQIETRIKILSITPGENTGQDYSSWLSDDLTNLVPSVWSSANFKYIDVTLKLESKSMLTRLSLYDYEGVFTDYPATIYALNGTQKTLLGTFTGEQYKVFADIVLNNPTAADAIIIHKYCNNIPQKVQVYGNVINTGNPVDSLPSAVITFNNLPVKTAGDSAFILKAISTNTSTPITFVSSNLAVVMVAFTNGNWMATPVNPGTAIITASQTGNNSFKAAADNSKTLVVNVSGALTKIPIDAKRWFQLTNATVGLDGLFDGDTLLDIHTGWGKIIANYDSYYPVLNGEQIDVSKLRMYDGAGTTETQPIKLYAITGDGQKLLIATFIGTQYNAWVGPDANNPGQYYLPATLKNIKYLVMNSWNNFPTEIEFYGNYTVGKVITATVKKSHPLNNMFGVNGFEWNFEESAKSTVINSLSFKAAKNFTGFRHYMDWEKLETLQGSYSFNPTQSGGWNYDALYDSCKAAGIEVLSCLKQQPPWMINSYPSGQQEASNVPVLYGKDFTDPASYIEQAKVAFQYVARYGSNKTVDRSLLSVNTVSRWSGDIVNVIKVGLGTVHYIECDNERDKWWKGRKAYQTAFEYAANLSAFYDGNKNTMGPGVGVKNADAAMNVVMGGVALATTDYLKGMVDWCRQNRGYNTDGTVNLCWDVINYHLYSNDAKSSQTGNPTRGAAPEVSGTADVAADFIDAAHKYANDMPVWVTELGYDINQGSPFKAIPIGNKTALQTQADWILRSSLLYARTGVERIFFYEMYDDNIANTIQFASSGLLNPDKSRKPSADYLYQASKLIGNYIYSATINNDPLVDVYKLNDKSAYVVVVPDEKGRTATYTLDLGNAGYANIYTLSIGSDTMAVQLVTTTNGKLTIIATETPVFILPVYNPANFPTQNSGSLRINALVEPTSSIENLIQVYPNPSSDFINIAMSTKSSERVQVKILEAGSGRVFQNIFFNKTVGYTSKAIDIHALETGYYYIEIIQGKEKLIKKFMKAY